MCVSCMSGETVCCIACRWSKINRRERVLRANAVRETRSEFVLHANICREGGRRVEQRRVDPGTEHQRRPGSYTTGTALVARKT